MLKTLPGMTVETTPRQARIGSQPMLASARCRQNGWPMPPRIVVDTSVLVAALLRARAGAAGSRVLRLCLQRRCQPLMGAKLFLECESVLTRQELFVHCPLSPAERHEFFAGFAAVCDWVPVFYLWRPNLPDEGDNHVLELAVAGGARCLVTQNIRDFRRAELRFPDIAVLTPEEFLQTVN
jgi:predicted nucleic acid-binding protein